MWILIVIANVVVLACLIYYYFTKDYDRFEKQGLPGPKPRFPLGNFSWDVFLQKRNVTYNYDDIYKQYRGKAPFVGYFEISTPQLLLIDPETIKTVLIKNFKNFHDNTFSKMTDKDVDPLFARNPFMLRGDEWKEKRAEITPAFTPNRIKALFPLVEEILHRFTKYINDEIKKDTGEPFDAREICAKFTTDVVSSCVFNADAQSFTKEKPEIREMGRKFFQQTPFLTFLFMLYMFVPALSKVYKLRLVPKELENFFTNLMHQAVEQRKKDKIDRDDYLAYLISMRSKKQFSDLDMAAHGVTFFIDGFETSSLAITHTLYELAANKHVQDKLRKEIQDIFDETGKIIYEKVIDSEYLDQVFFEALRMHPPATITNRECTEDIELEGANGKMFKLKKGDALYLSIYSIHHDPEYYPEPEKFHPERFNPENGGVKAFKDKGVYLAFGDGPRICLGMRFALMQSKAAIAELVRNFEISVNKKTQTPLVISPSEFINVKSGGIWLDFKPIK